MSGTVNTFQINYDINQIDQFEQQNGDNSGLDDIKTDLQKLNPDDPSTARELVSLGQLINSEEQQQTTTGGQPSIDPGSGQVPLQAQQMDPNSINQMV